MKGFNSHKEYLVQKNGVTHKSFKIESSTSIFFGSTPPYTRWVSHQDFYVETSMQLFMLGIALECRLSEIEPTLCITSCSPFSFMKARGSELYLTLNL
jgi:hypothetical protein